MEQEESKIQTNDKDEVTLDLNKEGLSGKVSIDELNNSIDVNDPDSKVEGQTVILGGNKNANQEERGEMK